MIIRYTITPSVKGTGRSKYIDAYTTHRAELMTLTGLREFANTLYRDDNIDAAWYDARRRDCIKAKQKTYWADTWSERGYFMDCIPPATRRKYLTQKIRDSLDKGKSVTFYAIEF